MRIKRSTIKCLAKTVLPIALVAGSYYLGLKALNNAHDVYSPNRHYPKSLQHYSQSSQKSEKTLEEKLTEDIKPVNNEILKEGHTNDCFYVKPVYLENSNKPRVILIADNHDISNKRDDYPNFIEILTKHVDSFGVEFGYTGENPLKGYIELTNIVFEKFGYPTIDEAYTKNNSKTIKKLYEINSEIYSVECRENILEGTFLVKLAENFEKGKEKLKDREELEKYLELYKFVKDNFSCNLHDIDKIEEISPNITRATYESMDKRSDIAPNNIEKYFNSNTNKTTAIIYGGYHIPEVSHSLKQKDIPHIIISTKGIDELVSKEKQKNQSIQQQSLHGN